MDEQSVLDNALSKEWSLLELPEPTLHTSEFEQIFGASDDENDEFPLSLKGLSGEVDIVGNDPQTSHFLISSIQETLSLEGLGDGRVDSNQSVRSIQEDTNRVADILPAKLDSLDSKHEQMKERVKGGEVRETAVDIDGAAAESTEEEKKKMSASAIVRKSPRLQLKRSSDRVHFPDDYQSKVSKPSKDEESEKDSEKSEKASLQSSSCSTKPLLLKLDRDEVTGEEEKMEVEESGDEDCSSESDEDPDRLWCICRQPHNDRFMICCDKCGEWYHGDCIGISVAEGKKMERMGEDYICIRCCDQEKELKKEREKSRSLRQARRDSIREKQMSRERIASSSSAATPTDKNLSDLDKLFKPDNVPEALTSPHEPKPEVMKGPCIGPNCSKAAIKPALYCSERCIERHLSKALERLAARGTSISSDPMDRIKGGGGVTFYEPSTRKYLMGVSAPSLKDTLPWLKAHPSYRVFVPAGKAPPKKIHKTGDVETKSSQPPQEPTATTPTQSNPNSTRDNVKNAFKRALWLRCQDAADITLTEEEVEKIAHDIEVKLFNVHNQEVTNKYRNKCRSLIFNLKDTKNPGLFRKVLSGEITTRQLVRMNPEQLASEDLTNWREKLIKKELDMIKEVAAEEVQMMSTHTVRKMTYKGEVEIERASENELPVEKPETSSQVKVAEPEVKQSVTVPSTSQAPPTQPNKPKANVGILSILTNTTDQHGAHVFDQNCDICLGKKPPPEKSSSPPQTTKEPMVVPSSSEEKDVVESQTVPSPTLPEASTPTMKKSPNDTSPTSSSLSLRVTSSLKPIWRGYMSMHGMEQFLTTAYPVSGNVDGLSEIFPSCLQVVGRIAHVQVWDYIDKLRSSLSKEIAVIHFERVAEDESLYLEMMDYLVGKHRYGVFQTFSSWMKDMYLVPLQFDDPPPMQILPFVGPGLPVSRRDLFLGIIVRTIKHPSLPDKVQPSKHTSRVHFSSDLSQSSSSLPKSKRPRLEGKLNESTSPITPLEVETTTPPVSVFPGESSKDEAPVTTLTPSNHSDKTTSPVAVVSFYGQHKPLQVEEKVAPNQRSPTISQSRIQSILSQLSDQKLQELASAMSSLQQPRTEPGIAEHKPSSLSAPSKVTPPVRSGDNHVTQSTTMSLDERLSATFGYSAKPSQRKEESVPVSQQHWDPQLTSQEKSQYRHTQGGQDGSPQASWSETHPSSQSQTTYSNSQPNISCATVYDARRSGGPKPKPSFFSPPPISHPSQDASQLQPQEQSRQPYHPSYPSQHPQSHPNQSQPHPSKPQPHPNKPQPHPSDYYNNQSRLHQQPYHHSHGSYYDDRQTQSAPYQPPPAANYYANQPQHGYHHHQHGSQDYQYGSQDHQYGSQDHQYGSRDHQYGSQDRQYPSHYQQHHQAGSYSQQDQYGGGREREWHDGSHFNHHHQQHSPWRGAQGEGRRGRGQHFHDDRPLGKSHRNPDFRTSRGPHAQRPWGR